MDAFNIFKQGANDSCSSDDERERENQIFGQLGRNKTPMARRGGYTSRDLGYDRSGNRNQLRSGVKSSAKQYSTIRKRNANAEDKNMSNKNKKKAFSKQRMPFYKPVNCLNQALAKTIQQNKSEVFLEEKAGNENQENDNSNWVDDSAKEGKI